MSSGHMSEALSVYMSDLHAEPGFSLKVLESRNYQFLLCPASLNEPAKALHSRGGPCGRPQN
jgi:hypothetical protein